MRERYSPRLNLPLTRQQPRLLDFTRTQYLWATASTGERPILPLRRLGETQSDTLVHSTSIGAQPFVGERDSDDGKEGEEECEFGGDVPATEDNAGVFNLGVPSEEVSVNVTVQITTCSRCGEEEYR